jgi:hypothetical protein
VFALVCWRFSVKHEVFEDSEKPKIFGFDLWIGARSVIQFSLYQLLTHKVGYAIRFQHLSSLLTQRRLRLAFCGSDGSPHVSSNDCGRNKPRLSLQKISGALPAWTVLGAFQRHEIRV